MEQDKYVGKRLEGRYDIIESIGKGGMANVYKAMDLIDERIVAVKILRDEYLDNTEFLRRFKNESKAIAVLSHPNIVRVYDVSFTDSVHSIVMEYIDGVPLKSYIERQGAIEWKHALHFTLQILHALQHAHDKGIVHRDIKPQNIMLLENGDIKVTDFGIARFARSEVRTISDRAIGTVHYISPEQAMGGNTDEKSDIYSVGVMLFEMLTGKLPFEAESAMSVAMKQIHSQVTRPRSLNPAIPEGLEEITLRAMQKQQKYRYQSAAEMISDIEKFRAAPNTRFGYQFPAEDKNANGDKPRVRNPNHVSRDRGVRADRDREEIVEHKVKTPFLPILTGVTLAFMLAAMAFVGLMLYINNPFMVVAEETLPNLIGIKLDTALHQYDFFDIIVETEEFSNEYGLGVIFEQRPRPNTSIRVGSAVRVTVSRGQEIVTLPNFAGVSASQTISKIIDLGLRVNEVRMFSDEVSAGRVVYTDPSRDSLVGSGETVTVYVSNGPEVRLTSVPNLIGQNIDTAIRLLEQRGLALGEVVEVPSDWPSGTIVSHDPVEGDLQMEGTMINVE
ncbi:MAG: Stk1 family PASTA domain-containing Ser/Thr kinase, partial [Oscillospiraceae bacterium]|nr:Stk1 family PASTA domain-containing Ser/Thr kinase [Oscillospiraceae bacterium]